MMRREIQMIVLVLLGMLCVNIVTAQNVRQKPVVKKQATTTKKQSAATTSKKQPISTAKKQSTPTTKAKSAVKDEKKIVSDTRTPAGISVGPDNIKVQETTPKNNDDAVFDVVEQMPSFPGGNSELARFLGANVQYPVIAAENGIEGRVIVSFIVDHDGSITDVCVSRSIEASLDKEAVRVVKMMPKWNPGKHKGQAVRVKFAVPINFKLQGSSSSKSSTITVRGTVVDKRDEPIIGAVIRTEGTTISVVSDLNGNFSMDVPKSGETKLNVSYVGCKKKTVKVDKSNNTPLKIVMK